MNGKDKEPDLLSRINGEARNHEVRNDEARNDEARNDEVRNDEVRNNEVRNDEIGNHETRNDETRNDKIRDDEIRSNGILRNDDIRSAETRHNSEEMKLGRILGRYTIEAPTTADTAQFAAGLLRHWDAAEEPSPAAGTGKPFHMLQMIQAQLKLFRWSFWLASAAILVLGLLVEVAAGSESAVRPFIFTAPLLAALGVCFAFRSYGTPMFRLEMSLPVTPMLLIFGRLTIIVAYNSLLGICLSLLLAGGAGSGIGAYVFSWLVPLGVTCLSALIVMLHAGLNAGIFMSVLVWSVQLWLNKHLGMFYIFSSETSGYWMESKVIGVLLIVLLSGLLWLRIRWLKSSGRLAVSNGN